MSSLGLRTIAMGQIIISRQSSIVSLRRLVYCFSLFNPWFYHNLLCMLWFYCGFRFKIKYCSLRTVSQFTKSQQQQSMATASILQWIPESLYNLSISVTVCSYHIYRADVKSLPDSVQFDVLYKVRHGAVGCIGCCTWDPVYETKSEIPSANQKPGITVSKWP